MFNFRKPIEVRIAGLEAELEAITETINKTKAFPMCWVDRRLKLVRIIAELKYKAKAALEAAEKVREKKC